MNKKHFDQHLHSSFSCDAARDYPIDKIVEAAIMKGLSGIAITDHFDALWPMEYRYEGEPINVLDLPSYEVALTEAESNYSDRIQFAKGIELGFFYGEALDICKEAVSNYPYDFIIGSVHHSETTPTDVPAFIEGRTTEEVLEEYYTIILDSIRDYKDYDVLGHINSIDRYTDEVPPASLSMPYIDEILKVAISDGKGIEINTSAYGRYKRHGDDYGTPSVSILKRFKELGGEIVTLGSDAHKSADVGTFIEEGENILRSVGFKYQAFFKSRKPEFFSL